jgi:hypothetical protein
MRHSEGDKPITVGVARRMSSGNVVRRAATTLTNTAATGLFRSSEKSVYAVRTVAGNV